MTGAVRDVSYKPFTAPLDLLGTPDDQRETSEEFNFASALPGVLRVGPVGVLGQRAHRCGGAGLRGVSHDEVHRDRLAGGHSGRR